MENQGVVVDVNVVEKKSNAGWICGLIGFMTSIPNTLCAFICAGVTAGIASEVARSNAAEQAVAEGASADAAAAAVKEAEVAAAGGVAGYFWVIVLVSVVCFILSFMGKGKYSLITGILVLLGGMFILINGFIGLGSMLWGTATGILYMLSGIVAILNRNKRN